jgi:hypothetical protein
VRAAIEDGLRATADVRRWLPAGPPPARNPLVILPTDDPVRELSIALVLALADLDAAHAVLEPHGRLAAVETTLRYIQHAPSSFAKALRALVELLGPRWA